ncbi:MAG TPA: ribonuclease E/G [Sporolactobacillaceae bacterium]|nr:ribonuclease E/G [Sporolactobacillaceae bacterium]
MGDQMRQIVLDSKGPTRRAAVLQDQTPVAFYAAPENQSIHVNDILAVKVSEIRPGLDGVFVRLPYGQKGFLPKKEYEPFAINQPMDALSTGDRLLLQVKREPIGKKQAILTRNIQIRGDAIIYLPFGNYVAVSHRIEEKKREQLKQTAEVWIQPPEGAILRSTFPSCTEEEISKEWSQLRATWDKLLRDAQAAAPPCCLYSAPFLAAELVSLVPKEDTKVWVTNDHDEAVFLEQLGEHVTYDESPDLFQTYQLEKAWSGALKPRVHLKSGLSLIIEETQALTSIDVNTGSFKGAESKEETAYIGNLEAVNAIARELSLRQLGGIILIDLLKMEEPDHREDVLTRFKEALRQDFASTYISGYTGLGLLELTRKKTRYSLSRLASSRNHD